MQPPGTLPPRTLSTLLRRYGAGEPLSCEPVPQGLLNRGYRIATTRGRFFLKHHLDGDPVTIDHQHRTTTRLGALGLPVVPPIPDPHGRTVAVVGGRCYALHPWIEGRHRGGGELTRAQSRRLGALLGLVHVRLEQVIPDSPHAGALPPHTSADPAHTHDLIDELLARIRARRSPDSFDVLAEYRLLERRALLREHAHRRPAEGTEPVAGWVHGDFHPLNLLYRTEAPFDPVAIVDWDRLGVQPRAEEAVRAAAIFFVRPDGTLDLSKVRGYARAYRRAAGADAAELAAAVHRVWWERLNDFWMLRWRYQLRDHRAEPQVSGGGGADRLVDPGVRAGTHRVLRLAGDPPGPRHAAQPRIDRGPGRGGFGETPPDHDVVATLPVAIPPGLTCGCLAGSQGRDQ